MREYHGFCLKSWNKGQGKWLFPSMGHLGGYIWRTVSSFGSLNKNASWANWSESNGGSPRRLGDWNMLHKVRLRELSLLNLQKKRLSNSGSECSLPLLKEGVERRWSQTFPRDVQQKEKRQRSRVAAKEFQIDKWKKMTRVVKHWHKLPRGAVDSLSLEVLKAQLGKQPEQPDLTLKLVLFWGGDWIRWPQKVLCNLR